MSKLSTKHHPSKTPTTLKRPQNRKRKNHNYHPDQTPTPAKSQTISTTIRAVITTPLLIVGGIILTAVVIFGGAYLAQSALDYQADSRLDRLAALSNHDSGATLDEVITTIQADMPEYEIIFVFDENGNKLIEQTNYSPLGASLTDDAYMYLRQLSHLTHVHTHPCHDNGHTDQDLSMPADVGLADSIDTLGIISTDHAYYLDRGDQSWPTKSELIQYFGLLYNYYGPLVDAGFMDDPIIDGKIFPYLTNRCLDQLAGDLGYTFYIEGAALG